MAVESGSYAATGKKAGLRIDTHAACREKAGLSETPIGKAADEYKYCARHHARGDSD